MSRKTFIAAANLAEEYGQAIEIGGGEPTLHPLFWDFMGIALSHKRNCEMIWLATNGSVKHIALALAEMAKQGIISARLSRDQFHDKIDDEVIEAFTKNSFTPYNTNDSREISKHISPQHIINAGRAKRNGIGIRKECPCDVCFITPQGRIYACGCKKESWGTIFKPEIPENAMFDNYCSTYGVS
jgi:MoaA/NifB/PqqE/SkfB family radical SAM enzyme